MFALRYVAVLALTAWVGGLVFLAAVAAPSAFDVLGATVSHGRPVAGAVFGEMLRRFHLGTYACAAIVLLSLLARGVLGPRPRRFGLRLGTAAMMLAASLYASVVVSAQTGRAQAEPGVPSSSLPDGDPGRAAFGRLRATSTSLGLIPLAGGLILLFWELRD